MSPILFKDITKNEENKTAQLTSNVTFNSVYNIIFYTLKTSAKTKNPDFAGAFPKCCDESCCVF